MASTNPFQHADADAIDDLNDSITDVGVRGRRARRMAAGKASDRKMSGRGERLKQRKKALRASMDNGFPKWEGLAPVCLFLIFPAMLAIGIALTGPWPIWLLYGCAGLMGLYVFSTAFHTAELVLVCFLLYVPFSGTYVIPVAPGVNGTNMLILLGIFATVLRRVDKRQTIIAWPPGTTVVFIFGVLSSLSGITIWREPGGYVHLMHHELLSYKAWIDQFILYFIAISCIRTIEQAKRIVVYLALGSIILVLYSVPEMYSKMGLSSIDKSRIGGPHQQPNMFGGFVAYTMLIPVALFVTYIKDIRAWLLTPYFLLGLKVLISTFSRGAYLAIAVGGLMAGYFRGKSFLLFWGVMALTLLLVFPNLFPQAIRDRFDINDEPTVISTGPEKLDKSSEHRIILWRAGGKMILESPILGKGFKGFQKLKAQYTDRDVHESDPHNTYIYIASQMGLPALILFLMILGHAFHLGRALSRNKEDLFIRAVGVAGASATVCYAVICIFGSRAVNLEFTSYFWALLVCMQVIDFELRKKAKAEKPKKRRTNAFAERSSEPSPAPTMAASTATGPELDDDGPRLSLPSPEAKQRRRKRAENSMADAREQRRRLKHNRDK